MAQKHPIATIGSREIVDFPNINVFGIPAKIDTGADSSSIWVSDIEPVTDGLSFVLFAPGSRYFSGERIVVKTYETAAVKNSSGVAEFRYKVRLAVRIQGRTIRAWFTLADRSGMTYPVLIGRRLLKNKFVVDVSQALQPKAGDDKAKRILVVASKTDGLEKFCELVQKKTQGDVVFVVRSYEQLVFWIQVGKTSVRETVNDEDIANFDMVYFKSHRQYRELAIAAAQYLQFHHVNFFDKDVANGILYDKLSSYMRLALYNIPVPPTFCALDTVMRDKFREVTKVLGKTLVSKEINQNRGRKNYLIQNLEEFDEAIHGRQLPTDIFMLQPFIKNKGYIRVYVFGRKAAPLIARLPVPHTNRFKAHLNEPIGSKNAELITEDDARWVTLQDMAVRAADLVNRQVAGVDLIQDQKTGKWYVLEVNGAPQLKTGSFTEEKVVSFARFVDNELNR